MDFTLTADGAAADVRLRAAGTHNIYNALAAAAAALAVGMPLDAVKFGLDDFSPVAMRSEIKEVEGRTVLADYYNANPASMEAALGHAGFAFPGQEIDRRARRHARAWARPPRTPTGKSAGRAARSGVDIVITLGALAKHIGEGAVEGGMPQERVFEAPAHAEAAELLKKLSGPGDVSPDQGLAGHEDGKDPGGVLMLYHLLYPLRDKFGGFNVFRYITFRSAGAVLTALLVSFILAPSMIAWLRRLKVGQHVRDDGPQTHLTKQGTPTMGGLLIIAALVSSVLLWSDLTNKYVWVVLFATLAFGGIGFWDDYLKVVKKRSTGLRAVQKFGLQIAASLAIGIFPLLQPERPEQHHPVRAVHESSCSSIWAGFTFPLWSVVIVGSSNAVNLTDGLDGLAIGLVGIASTANAVIVYLGGNKIIADYLKILYIPGSGELAIFCGAMLGASLGFLWYNAHPAEVFMGDVGSLSLGGALGTLAVVTKHELILVIVGGIFVAETVSVMLQVASYKLTGKRIFKMAPVHHHFEQIGWPESKVIVRFWIVGIILALISIGSLKLR